MTKTDVNLNITLTQVYWAGFMLGAGVLSGIAAVVAFATTLRSIARFVGVAG